MDETGRPDRGRSHGPGRASKRGRPSLHEAFRRRAMAQARSKFPRDVASEAAPGDATVSLAPGSAGGHSRLNSSTLESTFACDVNEPFGD